MKRSTFLPILILAGLILEGRAQSFFTNVPQYIAPSFRGSANSEFSQWDIFYSPYQSQDYPNGVNYPDMAAPFGTGQLSSEAGVSSPANSTPGDPYAFWNVANPTIAETLEPGAFIIGAGATGNIYSFSGPTGFVLSDTTPYTLGAANLQWQTDGTLIDFSTLKLNYVSGGVTISLAPTNFVAEYQASGSSFGFSLRNRTSAQWNLTGLNITSYTITYQAAGSSDSFQEALLDTSDTYTEATPSTRGWTGGGADTKWSTAANWSGSALPSARGNVTFSAGSGVVVDGAKEVSLLTLGGPGNFAISASNGAKLQINTGITATSGTTTISAPVTFGSFNLMTIGAGADVTLAGAINGVGGFYKSGAGVLRLTGNNTFSGQMTIDGGTTYVGGTNTYTGVTSIASGRLVAQADAPGGAAGALGNATSAVLIGSGEDLGTPQAALVIDGAHTVARNITLSAGGDPKLLGGQNTGAGAVFSGGVTLTSTTTGVSLDAANAGDRVTFSGAITGGATGSSITKTGAGVVVFSGGNKGYLNDTAVTAGTLEIDENVSLRGLTISSGAKAVVGVGANASFAGTATVNPGAALLIYGALSGAGDLVINGGTVGGTGTVNRSITLDNGDVLAPGNNPGTLNTLGETWGAGGRLQFQTDSVTSGPGVGWDFVNVNGTLDLLASGVGKFTIELDSLSAAGMAGLLPGFNESSNYSWKIASASGGITGFDAGAFQIDAGGFVNSHGGAFSMSQSGNDLFLVYTSVPEPTVGLLGVLGVLAFSSRRRRGGIVRVCVRQARPIGTI